jgi:hypothetical protein
MTFTTASGAGGVRQQFRRERRPVGGRVEELRHDRVDPDAVQRSSRSRMRTS